MRDPELRGSFGMAWRRRRPPSRLAQMGLLDSWYFRYAGPDVSEKGMFVVSVIELIAIKGEPPPYKEYPDARYEVHVARVDDTQDPDAVGFRPVEGDARLAFQFHGVNQGAAAAIARVVVSICIRGGLAPKRSRRTEWTSVLAALIARARKRVPEGEA